MLASPSANVTEPPDSATLTREIEQSVSAAIWRLLCARYVRALCASDVLVASALHRSYEHLRTNHSGAFDVSIVAP